MIIYGKKWEINTRQDYDNAMEDLRYDAFCAEMSDSYATTCAEKSEIRKQMNEVTRQAVEKGFIQMEDAR